MACIRTDLISGASAVSLVPRPEDYSAQIVLRPRPALRRFSVPDCWAGPVNEATVVSRDYLSSCTSSTPCFLFCPAWAYSACVLFAVLFQRRGVRHALVRFYVFLSGSSIVCGVFRRSLREYDCAISTTPRNFTSIYHKFIFKFFTTRLSLFNEYEYFYGTTYKYIQTYIQTPLAFNTLM